MFLYTSKSFDYEERWSLLLEGQHTKESNETTKYTTEYEENQTFSPIMKIIATLHQWTTPGYKPHPRVPEGDSKFSRLKFTSISQVKSKNIFEARVYVEEGATCVRHTYREKNSTGTSLYSLSLECIRQERKASYNTFQHLQRQRLPKPTLDSKIFLHILRYQYLYPGLRWESKQQEGGHTTAGPNEKAHHVQTTMENIVLLPSMKGVFNIITF